MYAHNIIEYGFYISLFLFILTIILSLDGKGIIGNEINSKIFLILFTICIILAFEAKKVGGLDFLGDILIRSLEIIIISVIYLIPSIIAKERKHLNFLSIFFTNLFLGWTIIGWIIAIIWSGSDNTVNS